MIFIEDNICMLSEDSVKDNGLITCLLHELKKSPITFFQEFIPWNMLPSKKVHSNVFIASCITDIEDKIRILKHADELNIPHTPLSPAMALPAFLPTMSTAHGQLLQHCKTPY
jgi:hypothetical protein